jgi:hypothetical protein
MHRPNRFRATLSFTAALAISAATIACSSQPPVVVDEAHNDSHRWDDHENQSWHRFLTENHRQDHEFAKSERNEQSEYWNWRHNHPD